MKNTLGTDASSFIYPCPNRCESTGGCNFCRKLTMTEVMQPVKEEVAKQQISRRVVGTIKAKFIRYYKYEFFFEDEYGKNWVAGGNVDDIYRFSVDREVSITPSENGAYYIDGCLATRY